MYSKSWAIILVVLMANRAIAEGCSKPVQYHLVGEPAKCSGYLFSPEKERELRLLNEDYKYLQLEIELKDKQVSKLRESVVLLEEITKKEQEKSELWRVKAEDSTKKYIESEEGRGRRDLMFLLGGILLTLGAAWGMGQISK